MLRMMIMRGRGKGRREDKEIRNKKGIERKRDRGEGMLPIKCLFVLVSNIVTISRVKL